MARKIHGKSDARFGPFCAGLAIFHGIYLLSKHADGKVADGFSATELYVLVLINHFDIKLITK